jgi:protein-tyrosine kinase
MSKIEQALSRAREERGNMQLVPVKGAPARPTGTDLVAERVAHPETIAHMAATDGTLLEPAELSRLGIICKSNIDDPAVRMFRELRTKISQQSKGGNCVVLVAGVSEGSGASFVAQNLSAAFALDKGKTALIVDCNFRNPNVHRLIGHQAPAGLAEYLENPEIDIGKIIYPVGIPRMRVIPTGERTSADTERFASVKMQNLVDALRQRYSERFIVLDAPPMTDTSDSRTLGEFADYILIVVRYGRATTTQIEKCASAFDPKKLLGVVFNDEPRFPR